jgi:hypothetical protein
MLSAYIVMLPSCPQLCLVSVASSRISHLGDFGQLGPVDDELQVGGRNFGETSRARAVHCVLQGAATVDKISLIKFKTLDTCHWLDRTRKLFI